MDRAPVGSSDAFVDHAHGRRGLPQLRLPYQPSLDGLRGVAILSVMAFHARLLPGGFFGVDIFFVLSGYLITALVVQEWQATGSISLGRFYARRALRLLPALLVLLLFFVGAPDLFAVPPTVSPVGVALIVLFYSANWATAFNLAYLHVLAPTWSLAIEEQFYLLWPPLLRLLLAFKVNRLWILCLLLVGIETAAALRVVLWNTGAAWRRINFGLDTRMDALLLGCFVGLLASWNVLEQVRWLRTLSRYGAVPAAGVVIVLLYFARETSSLVVHGLRLLVCAATAVLLVALLTSRSRVATMILEQPVLVWTGRISYGLYLWHLPIFRGLLNPHRLAGLDLVGARLQVVRFAGAFAAAAASFYLVERPLLRMKDRFRPSARDLPPVEIGAAGPALPGVAPRRPAVAPSGDAHSPAPGMARVLVVEDHPQTAQTFADLLRILGHEPVVARTAELALPLLDSGHPDLVLLDLLLPGMSGLDFLRAPELRASQLPVVAMSGGATDEEVLESLQLGALDFIPKPIGIDLLGEVVRYAGRRRTEPAAPNARTAERRRSSRPQVMIPTAVVEYGGPRWHGMAVDISTFGVRLRSRPPVTPTWAAKLHLGLPNGERMLARLSVLVRAEVDGCTFRFVNLTDREFDRLRGLIDRLAA